MSVGKDKEDEVAIGDGNSVRGGVDEKVEEK